MSKDTWNFPCYWANDLGTGNPRGTHGMVWECGTGAPADTQALPFTESITIIGSFLMRTGWTDLSYLSQGIASIGTTFATDATVQQTLIDVGGNEYGLQTYVWDTSSGFVRYQVRMGDADGVNWIQPDTWMQYAYSFTTSGMQFAMNGTTTPTNTIVVNAAGNINLESGNRLWLHRDSANTTLLPLNMTSGWPSLVIGPSAWHTTALDLSSATVRDRIWDGDGNFKNPGEDGSLWFGDTYQGDTPHIYLMDGSPRHERLSGHTWGSQNGGGSGSTTCPGGLRKQYE